MERNVNNDKRLKPLFHNDLHCFLGGCRLKTHSLSENTTCQSESYPRHSERSEESTCNREILARDVGEATSRTYRDTRKGTVIPLLQNDDLMCHSESLHVILSVSKDSVQKLTKCQVLNGGMLSQKQSFCVQYKN